MHDLVIENASLIDGLGRLRSPAAWPCAVSRIAAVGDAVGQGRERIDAGGLV
jgi:hypothetical protein